MTEAVGIAFAVFAGVDLRRVAILMTALVMPMSILGLAVVAIWMSRRTANSRSALFCEAVASELRSGLPLRESLTAALGSVGGHIPEGLTNAAMADVAHDIAAQFEDIGLELEMSIDAASRTGASMADLFDEIGAFAIARSEVDNELRVATAPARATALVFLAAPSMFVAGRLGSGGLKDLLAIPHQRAAALIGLGLFIGGILIAGLVMWRSR